jgi:Universal stress protein family
MTRQARINSGNVIDVSSCGDACHVWRERARLQSANGHVAHIVRSRNVRLRLAISEALERLTAKFHATPAIACTRKDQGPLELGQPTENGQHELAVGRGGVGPSIGQWSEARTGIKGQHRHVPSIPGTVPGQQLLSAARDEDADLLVMGAYGQVSWREFLFGGATREVVGVSLLPLLLAH